MKVYNGWILNIGGQEFKVDGSLKIRGVQSYLLAGANGKQSMKRDDLLAGMNNGSIKYVASVAP